MLDLKMRVLSSTRYEDFKFYRYRRVMPGTVVQITWAPNEYSLCRPIGVEIKERLLVEL